MSIKAGELRTPGIMTCISGNKVNLQAISRDDIDIRDIAWGLGRTLRYAGHIREDYSVALHSIIMSYIVPKKYAKEALLHDAAEAYIGDIIWPVKTLFPQIRKFENMILSEIMALYEVPTGKHTPRGFALSDKVKEYDEKLMSHECFDQGIRPGVFNNTIEKKWIAAAEKHSQYWWAPAYAFLQRFDELFKTSYFDIDELTKVWFPDEVNNSKAAESVQHALDMLLEQAEKEAADNAS